VHGTELAGLLERRQRLDEAAPQLVAQPAGVRSAQSCAVRGSGIA